MNNFIYLLLRRVVDNRNKQSRDKATSLNDVETSGNKSSIKFRVSFFF